MIEFVYAIIWAVAWAGLMALVKQKKDNEALLESAKKLNEVNNNLVAANENLRKKEKEATSIIDKAKAESEAIRQEASTIKAKAEWKLENLQYKEKDLEKKSKTIDEKEESLRKEKDHLREAKKLQEEEAKSFKERELVALERVASLTKEQAQDKLIAEVESLSQDVLLRQMKKMEDSVNEEAQKKAQKIITMAIQKYASEVASESTATVVYIDSDEIKWRVIWREWRNINALELATWVDIIIDDTPNSIVISWFDLFRRYIAKKSLEKLIEDWRIHPARIEEIVEKTKDEANSMLKELWEKALQEVWLTWIHPDLVKILWRLRFRTSYGQNILKHSAEVWYICSLLAWELWIDTEKAKMAWFFHDIWKAVDHEIEWSHAIIWYEILKKYKIPEDVAYAVWAHHEDMPVKSPLDFIVCAADCISWSRPGARRESMDMYIKRLKTLEDISCSFEWVEKAYAIQAWREVRVVVKPSEVNDFEAKQMALKITQKIEKDMSYPWQIKVHVLREVRIAEYAK